MKGERLKELVRGEIRGLQAYTVEKGLYKAKLDANESPFPLPPELHGELLTILERVPLNRYPDPDAGEARAAIAGRLGIPAERLILGNGSDECILLLLLALGGPVLSPIPTFVMYELASKALGLRFLGIPLGPRFELPLEQVLEIIRRERPKLIFLASPNNPTGNAFSEEEILKVVEASEGLVVVDEAYYPYAGRTLLPHLWRYENLAILRTLSKIGLAGIRVGYLIAHEALIEELNKVRPPYNVNALSQAVARFALEHEEAIQGQVKVVIEERERLFRALSELPELEVFPSEANFLLFRTKVPVEPVYLGLVEEGVLVRNLSNGPGLFNCLRVTVGTPEENDLFLETLREILARLSE